MKSTLEYEKIKRTLSLARLSTYENSSNTLPEALQLYQWNSNVSGAFLPCLHICEVSIRNSVSEVLLKVHGNQWAWEPGFMHSLSYKPKLNLEKVGKKFKKNKNINKVIPELDFVFWQSMFTARNDSNLWLPHFNNTFVYADSNIGVDVLRAEIYDDLDKIRKFRNRIAHHEPIFQRDLLAIYQSIVRLVGYRCCNTSQWLENNEIVLDLINNKPTFSSS